MVIGKLTKEQFLEWNLEIQKMKVTKESQLRVQTEHKLLERELEILKLRIMLHRQQLQEASKSHEYATKNYESTRLRIESELGIELKDCAIDELTLEIKKLD